MTCYLNSLLQTLFMTPEFRNALYRWEYKKKREDDAAKSIPFQLQRLFLQLQCEYESARRDTYLDIPLVEESMDAFVQPEILDGANQYFCEKCNKKCNAHKGPYVYELFSIMIHSGSAAGGHYYAYIKSFKDGQWYSFNDQQVTKLQEQQNKEEQERRPARTG
nr:hypothetical protein BaRGS_009282 [Batillaria attramentaria]